MPHLLKVRRSNNLFKSAFRLRHAERRDLADFFVISLTQHLARRKVLNFEFGLQIVNQEGEKFNIFKLFINFPDQVISNRLNSPLKFRERIGRSIKNRV